ncbi:unnamed protein product [Kluyveromyces dobzhanskii CBS 2104]|uniref:WGS project CCBQ000000000 data, contig 00099 n=1 Tax=Kluyveromyces dobzhanskii CBS 2104 TaxID=1427455 RepID=A0A0A8L1N7_9SACH|nr:unnamed protein product [Kluyveromyces dobzhanskii CBS 2104]
MSISHAVHMINVLFQCILLLIQLSWVKDESSWTKWNVSLNLFYVAVVYLNSTWLSYYKSSCAQGHGLFYFVVYSFVVAFEIGQRYFHPGSEKYNVVKNGQSAMLLDVLLWFNSLSIFTYDAFFFQYSPQLADYFTANNVYPPVNVLAGISFTWMNKLITDTYNANKIEDPSNMPLPPFDLDIAGATTAVKANWEYELWTDRKSLLLALLKTFGPTIAIAMSYEVSRNLLSVIQPQLFRKFIEVFNPDARDLPILNGFFVALGLFLLSIISTIISNQFFINIFEAGLKIRGSLMSLVYQKSLRLSLDARDDKASGDVLNLMSVDVIRIQRFFENAQVLVGAPIQLIGVLISLYFLLGTATIGGLVSIVIMIPINSYMTKLYKALFKTQMQYKDKRIKTVTEILNSMKSIKLYAWEKPMLDRLNHVRNDLELHNMKKIAVVSNFMFFCWNIVPLLVTCSTFVLFSYLTGKVLSPQVIFPALTLFSMLNDALFTVPTMISNIIEIGVSLKRLKGYLLAQELDSSFIERSKATASDPTIEITNAIFLWKSPKPVSDSENTDEEAEISSPGVALKNIKNFSAKKAQLTCIVGRVGSGKSTFLQAILGQLPCVSSDVTSGVKPKLVIRAENLAYCPQQPWIMNASLKDNILFGYKYDEAMYNETIKACQLLPDMKILPDGDQTLVGEKGISLSGGQKARLSLARAVYSRSDLYLLDDVLSAVDSHVCKNIIDEVLDRKNGLLRNKTVILTTNAVNVLIHSDMIYLLKEGEIVEKNSYKEVMSKDKDSGEKSSLREIIEEFASEENNENTEKDSGSFATADKTSHLSTPNDGDDDDDSQGDPQPPEHLLNYEVTKNPSTNTVTAYEEEQENAALSKVTSRRASIATLRPRPLIDMNNDARKTAQKAETKEEGRVKKICLLSIH